MSKKYNNQSFSIANPIINPIENKSLILKFAIGISSVAIVSTGAYFLYNKIYKKQPCKDRRILPEMRETDAEYIQYLHPIKNNKITQTVQTDIITYETNNVSDDDETNNLLDDDETNNLLDDEVETNNLSDDEVETKCTC